jgi:transposase
MGRKRRKFTDNFKAQVALEALRGDRAANSALHIIAIGRLRTDQRTKEYVAKRISEGHSKLEAIRMLKRYISREVYTIIVRRQRQINQAQIAA